jgi:hypothetical protein
LRRIILQERTQRLDIRAGRVCIAFAFIEWLEGFSDRFKSSSRSLGVVEE